MTRWGMVMDLGRCVGCQTCTIACKMENGLPPGTLWRTVLDLESGEFPDVRRQFFPMTCMHCADPPCFDACPTTATRVREDGIVWINNDFCIGCGSCVVACPYQARHLVPKERYYFGDATAPETATYDRARVGICTKCHFCFHKFDEAPAGARPGEDPVYTPACAASCIADVIRFGDLDDPESSVSRLLAENGGGKQMLPHLGTDPSVFHLQAPAIEPRAPERQHTWHWLAVSNFFFGTTGVGLYALAAGLGGLGAAGAPLVDLSRPLASLAESLSAGLTLQQLAGLVAPVLVAIGLLSVAAEAGRPLRGFKVLFNFRRSWMSRESALAIAFMALAALDTLFVANPALQALAALCGLGVAWAQGQILSRAKGVPAWSVSVMPAYFLISALLFGGGALLVLAGLGGAAPVGATGLSGLVLALILADLLVWWLYLGSPPKTETFRHSVAVMRGWPVMLGQVGAGHLLPLLLLLGVLPFPAAAAGLMAAAGLLVLAGGLFARHALIIRAAFLVDLFDGFSAAASVSPRAPANLDAIRSAA